MMAASILVCRESKAWILLQERQSVRKCSVAIIPLVAAKSLFVGRGHVLDEQLSVWKPLFYLKKFAMVAVNIPMIS